MIDPLDEELDRDPEGSILTPIFMGCGAMGLGCLFSVGAIAIGIVIFFPGIFTLIQDFSAAPMREQALALAEANPAVVAELGTPLEAEVDDIDEAPGTDAVNVEVGDELEISVHYILVGPSGVGRMDVVGTRELLADAEWTITSLVVTPTGGEMIRVFPAPGDVPPLPDQLAPPGPGQLAPPQLPAGSTDATEPGEGALPERGAEGDLVPAAEQAEDAPTDTQIESEMGADTGAEAGDDTGEAAPSGP